VDCWSVGVILSFQRVYVSSKTAPRNGTIVSGDSLGMVKFWDSRTCTQLQSFQAHGADVLCLTISPVCYTLPKFSVYSFFYRLGRINSVHVRR
jgi:WD40 repeat protein